MCVLVNSRFTENSSMSICVTPLSLRWGCYRSCQYRATAPGGPPFCEPPCATLCQVREAEPKRQDSFFNSHIEMALPQLLFSCYSFVINEVIFHPCRSPHCLSSPIKWCSILATPPSFHPRNSYHFSLLAAPCCRAPSPHECSSPSPARHRLSTARLSSR
jgi:hypothetical protein